jgi:hypothetical protein
VVRVFAGREELQGRADGLVKQLKDHPTLAVGVAEWEWVADFQNRAADVSIAWLAAITLEDLTRATYDLTLYCDLIELVGPRSTEAIRIQPGSQFHTVVRDDGGGGMLLSAIKAKYYRGASMGETLNSNFLRGQVTKFLLEARWPPPYELAYTRWEDAAYDLPRRAAIGHAGRTEWCALVQDRLGQGNRVSVRGSTMRNGSSNLTSLGYQRAS